MDPASYDFWHREKNLVCEICTSWDCSENSFDPKSCTLTLFCKTLEITLKYGMSTFQISSQILKEPNITSYENPNSQLIYFNEIVGILTTALVATFA